MTAGHDEPESAAAGTTGGAAPRMARYGEGGEGRPARRERGLAERPREDNFFARAGKFVRDVRSELGRTTWPTRLEVRDTTVITVFAVIFFAAYLYLADRIFAFLFDQIHRLFGVS